MDCSEYYWLPWLRTYQQLQAATRTGTAGFEPELKQVQQWLQEGATCFKPPSEQAAAALKKGGTFKASAYGPQRGFSVDKQLAQATLELSQLLVSAVLLWQTQQATCGVIAHCSKDQVALHRAGIGRQHHITTVAAALALFYICLNHSA